MNKADMEHLAKESSTAHKATAPATKETTYCGIWDITEVKTSG